MADNHGRSETGKAIMDDVTQVRWDADMVVCSMLNVINYLT